MIGQGSHLRGSRDLGGQRSHNGAPGDWEGFFSRIFVIPKKGGQVWPVVNL